MGEHWSRGEYVDREDAEMLEKFFSRDMFGMRRVLPWVEWNIDTGNGGLQLISINQLGAQRRDECTGEMCSAHGTGFDRYFLLDPRNVELYSFEFDGLVSSYPANDEELRI